VIIAPPDQQLRPRRSAGRAKTRGSWSRWLLVSATRAAGRTRS